MSKGTIIGIVISLISIGFSYYFYLQSIEKREPVFAFDEVPTKILVANDIAYSPIEVYKGDGVKITNDLSSIKLYVWNKGKKSIKPENVLSPIVISSVDSLVSIIDVKKIKSSREIIDFKVERVEDSLIFLTFDILEKEDGCLLQILYEGESSQPFNITGIIEGYGDLIISPLPNNSSQKAKGNTLRSPDRVIVLILSSIILILFFITFLKYDKEKSQVIFLLNPPVNLKNIIFISLMMMLMIIFLIINVSSLIDMYSLPDWL